MFFKSKVLKLGDSGKRRLSPEVGVIGLFVAFNLSNPSWIRHQQANNVHDVRLPVVPSNVQLLTFR